MRIDFIITGLGLGGAEVQAVSLIERLVANKHEVRIISLITPVAFHDRLAAIGITPHSLGMCGLWHVPQALFRLLKLLKENPPEIVHSHMIHANILSRLARLFMPQLKLVCTIHSTSEGGRLRDLAYRLTNRLSQVNTTVSDAAGRRFIGSKKLPAHNTVVVFNGIDTQRFTHVERTQKNEEFTWLVVANFTPPKDYPNLLKAASLLKHGRLLVAGEGSLRPEIERLIAELQLQNKVQLLGQRLDVSELYHQADAFVLSSKREGYALVVGEAMASGLPIVVTDSGGPPEIVERDGKSGYVAPVEDPVLLAESMEKLMQLPAEERHAMGVHGRQRIQEHFSLEQIVLRWEELYRFLALA